MIFVVVIIVVYLMIAFELENAPQLSEDGKFVYKEHTTFFGIKLKKRKK